MAHRVNPDVPPIPGMEDGPPVKRIRLRREPTNEYLYVREVKGGAFQARVWLGVHEGGSLNLGLFTVSQWETREHAEWAAGRASREFRKRFRPQVGLKAVLESLVKDKLIPEHVLPPRVRLAGCGRFVGRVKLVKAGRVIETLAVADPWEAHRLMCEELAKAFPRGPSKSEVNAERRAREREAKEERARRRYQGGTLFV